MSEAKSVTPVVSVAVATKKKPWVNRKPQGIQNYRNFYGHGNARFYIYPDSGWNVKKWGPKPSLGIVYADDEFYAVREAYSKQLAPVNQTFGLIAVLEPLKQQ